MLNCFWVPSPPWYGTSYHALLFSGNFFRRVCLCVFDVRSHDTDRLRLAFLHQCPEQLLCQCLRRRRANLLALAALARGDGEDFPCHPVGSPIRLAINLANYRVARWFLVHGAITSSNKNR